MCGGQSLRNGEHAVQELTPTLILVLQLVSLTVACYMILQS